MGAARGTRQVAMGTSAFILPLRSKAKSSVERQLASAAAAALVAGGFVWVFATDVLLYALVTDARLIARVETAKGWVFVGFAALVVFVCTHWIARRMIRTRAAFSAVVDSIADGVFLVDRNRRIEYANPAAKRMLRHERLVGMDADEFSRRFHMSHADGSIVAPAEYLFQRVLDGEGGPLRRKVMLYPPGGSELVASVTASAVRDDFDSDPHLVVSVWHDVSTSEHLERTRNQFFAAAAHALKTPVAIIRTYAESTDADGASAAESLRGIRRQCCRIDRLVRNLLVLARTRTGPLELRHENVALAPAIQGSLHELTFEATRHRLVHELASDCRARADADRVDLLVRDMVDLACRSAKPNSAVRVTLVRRADLAEIGVEYEPLPAEEREIGGTGMHDEAGIDRLVINAIVAAHRWTLRESRAALRVSLPTLSERA